ncbi:MULTISPECIES: hypothetical protein [Streptomyces]|uniref:Uncharacterized protein n=1 Tax=Streptomyces pseudovenezuelae TaxID=67350 RepID=A0A101N6A3_9ACTN|nr:MULTISPECIES: hypothetical protein [Streptomyces]KUM87384.1 hypothetical protein AQI94_18780 [Streptomyces pseudovenezuelae]
MRGRLQRIDTVVAAGGTRLGDLLHGTAGAALGVPWTVTGGGVLTVVVAALVLLTGGRRSRHGIGTVAVKPGVLPPGSRRLS